MALNAEWACVWSASPMRMLMFILVRVWRAGFAWRHVRLDIPYWRGFVARLST